MKNIIQIEGFDKRTFEDLLKSTVEECIRELLPKEIPKKKSDKPVQIKEMAAILGKSVATIHTYKRRELIPFRKIGRSLFFYPEEVKAAMRKFNSNKNLNENYHE